MTTTTTMTMVESMFAEIASEMGYETWWEAETTWEEIEAEMIARGCDASATAELFADMAADL